MHRRSIPACAAIAVVLLGGATWFVTSPQPRAHNPLTQLVRNAMDNRLIEGRVEQRLDAGSYTYLALRTSDDDEPQWAVTMGSGAPPGAHVRVRSMGHSDNFYSRRLDRTFSSLVFGIVSRLDAPDTPTALTHANTVRSDREQTRSQR